MRSIASRLARLEDLKAQHAPKRRFVLHYGYLKTLFPEYIGPRHLVTVRRIPPEELPPCSRGDPWFEWEERPGAGPPKSDDGSDGQIIQVCYVESAKWDLQDEP